MNTAIVSCNCTHAYQDRRYGTGKRVANINAKGEGGCTVCSRKHAIKGYDFKKPKKGSGGSGGAKQQTMLPPEGGWPGGLPEKNGYKVI